MQAEKRTDFTHNPTSVTQPSVLYYLCSVPLCLCSFQLIMWGHSIQQELLGTSNNDNKGKPGRLSSLRAYSSLEKDMCVQKQC